MKREATAFIIAILAVLSSGCIQKPRQEYLDNYELVTQSPEKVLETAIKETGSSEADPEKDPQPQVYNGMQWIYKPDGKGSMICTITNVRAVKNNRDFDGNRFDDDGSIALVNPEYTEELFQQDHEKFPKYLYLNYPDSVDENGDLKDGYLILVDLTLENIDARNEYLNHQTGEMVPENGDPYVFRAMQFIFLQNRSTPEYMPSKNAHYFSGLNNLEVHPMAFRLEPGETTSIQIGFLTNEADCTWNLGDDLILNTIQNGSLDGIWFPLDLEMPEK